MKGHKILIIEDNFITLCEIEIRLQQMGYSTIATAVSGEEAIQKALSFKPELILSDINLGSGMDGIEAINTILKTIETPVIYLTAYDDDETKKRAASTRPHAFLTKPVQEYDLQTAILSALNPAST